MEAVKARVYYNDIPAGYLSKSDEGYRFMYEKSYLENNDLPQISLSFPKQSDAFFSRSLFPFFFGLLAEGEEKDLQCRKLKIDENDHFTRLIRTAGTNTIGAVTVREENTNG